MNRLKNSTKIEAVDLYKCFHSAKFDIQTGKKVGQVDWSVTGLSYSVSL